MAGSSKPHPDLAFQHLTHLKRATFQLTSEQDRTHHAHSIGAVYTNDAGKATRFTVLIVDAERQKVFRQGAGDDIATRRAEAQGRPFDPAAPALTITGWGAWDIDAMEADPHRQPVFVLAKWTWTDREGVVHKDGRMPDREHTAQAKRRFARGQEER